jgi:hypothetical protein
MTKSLPDQQPWLYWTPLWYSEMTDFQNSAFHISNRYCFSTKDLIDK